MRHCVRFDPQMLEHLRFPGSIASVIETLENYSVEELRALEDKYLAAFNFEHNSFVASPYSYTAKSK